MFLRVLRLSSLGTPTLCLDEVARFLEGGEGRFIRADRGGWQGWQKRLRCAAAGAFGREERFLPPP